MKKTHLALPSVWLATVLAAPAASLLTPSDIIFAYDLDANDVFPGGESPAQAVDGNPGTKYLNFGNRHSGLIMTPNSGASTARSLNFTTANDFDGRDPASYLLFGTNDPITSSNPGTANVNGFADDWTLIGGGLLSLPSSRLTTSGPVDLGNTASWSSYWMVFPTMKDNGGVMQIADVGLFDGLGASGTAILGTGAITVGTSWDSSFPLGESAMNLLDGDPNTKLLNFGKERSAIWVVPSAGPTTVKSFTITTAGDEPNRDPASWRLLGQDGSGSWTVIDDGTLGLTTDRLVESDNIAVSNSTAYNAYRMEFDTLRDGPNANSLQFAEIQFFDIIPEPSTSLLAFGGLLGLFVRRRKG